MCFVDEAEISEVIFLERKQAAWLILSLSLCQTNTLSTSLSLTPPLPLFLLLLHSVLIFHPLLLFTVPPPLCATVYLSVALLIRTVNTEGCFVSDCST